MKNYNEVLINLRSFRKKMDWERYHNPKDLSIAISIESAELLENFLWKNSNHHFNIENIKGELADIFIYLQYMADSLDIDLLDSVEEKLDYNKIRFKDGWKIKE